jgi:hypothetical protein
MDDALTFDVPPAQPLVEPARSRGRAARDVVVFSLSITAASALLALAVDAVSATRWSLAFVVLRWVIVAALLATPLVQQIAQRFGATWKLPYALRTPATAVLLTCESIVFDIVSAHFA